MKTLFIIITLFCISVIVISLSSQAYAIPYIPPPARYFNSDIVLIGKVVSSTPFSPTDTKYGIKVEQYLKNPQSTDTMTVIASGTNKSIGMTADTVFNVGQRVFLYLKQDQGNYIVWWYSHPTDFLCDPAPTAADLNSTNIPGAGLDYEPLHVGASKSNSHLYAPNQPIIIIYDAWNNQFTTKTFDVVFQVKNQTGQIIFNDTKQVELKPCIGHQIVNSTFTPKVGGTYETDVIFDNSLTGFTVQIPRPSGIEEVFLTLDKESYVPGDLMLIRGQVFLNATNVTISLEKNHKSSVITKDFPISKNGTFYANFTIPFDASAKSWTLATTVGGGTLREDFHFKSDSVPPLDQFWSGIAAKDIQCKKELQLVIKSEDGSPACVKSEHLARLVQYGWTISNLKIIGADDITDNGKLSESICGKFYTVPEDESNSHTIPVLILKQNSTGCAKVTFTVNFLFNNTNDCIGCNSQMVKIGNLISIGKYNYTGNRNYFGISNVDATHMFKIKTIPDMIDISKYPIGSNFTAIFIITPQPNATGFYDHSIVKQVCNAYPLAVGYSQDQINSSDFSNGLDFMQNHPCALGSYGISSVQVSGMSYVQMKLD